MRVEDFRILKVIDKFQFVYKNFGVDYKSMRNILKFKILMGSRRVPTIYEGKEDTKNPFKKALISYAIMGIFFATIVLLPVPIMLKMSLNIGGIMFLIMTTMISDFSSVLLDIKDKNILNTKPLDYKTINAAKTTHILIYMIAITTAIAGPTLIAGVFQYKFTFFLIFFIQIILMCIFTIFLTSMLYYFILKAFDGEKLKDIINYFQIVLSIFLILAYQIIPRVFDFSAGKFNMNIKWWSYLVPPVWFGAPYSMIIEGNTTPEYIVLSIMCVIVPIIIFAIYYKFILVYFEGNLEKLDGSVGKESSVEERHGLRQEKLSKFFCKGRVEKAFFRFTRNMVSTERKFKLKLYPSLAFAVVFPFLIFMGSFSKEESFSNGFRQFSQGQSYYALYLTIIMLVINIALLSQSDKHKAAWIYGVLPIDNPGEMKKGALKGFSTKYIIPIFIIMGIIFSIIFGKRIIPDLVVMFFTTLIFIVITDSFYKKELPFYKDFENKEGGSLASLIALACLMGIFFMAHKVCRTLIKNPFGIYGYIIILLVVNAVIWRNSFNIKWEYIMNKNKKSIDISKKECEECRDNASV